MVVDDDDDVDDDECCLPSQCQGKVTTGWSRDQMESFPDMQQGRSQLSSWMPLIELPCLVQVISHHHSSHLRGSVIADDGYRHHHHHHHHQASQCTDDDDDDDDTDQAW